MQMVKIALYFFKRRGCKLTPLSGNMSSLNRKLVVS